MFTGLVEEVGTITSLVERGGNHRITIQAPITAKELQQGNSVAVSGVCLTALDIKPGTFCADLAKETWTRTSFSRITQGAQVNLELPLKVDARMGGHIVQGHVDGIGHIRRFDREGDAWNLEIEYPEKDANYIVEKGSISVDGISLTVATIGSGTFSVAIIPHTFENTNLKAAKAGDPVNLEFDILAKYVEKMIGTRAR